MSFHLHHETARLLSYNLKDTGRMPRVPGGPMFVVGPA